MNIVSLLTVAITLDGIVLGILGIPPKKVKQVKAMIKKEEDTEADAGKAALIEVEVPNPEEVRLPEQQQGTVDVQELNYVPLLFGKAAECESADAEGDVTGYASLQSFIKKEPYLCAGHPIEQWADGTNARYGCKASIAECASICNSHSSQCKAFVWRRSDSFRSNCYWQASPLAHTHHPEQWIEDVPLEQAVSMGSEGRKKERIDDDCYIAKTVADTEPGKTLLLRMVEVREAREEFLFGPCKHMFEEWSVSDTPEMKASDAIMDALARKCCSAVLQGKVEEVLYMPFGLGVLPSAYCALYNLLPFPFPETEPEGVEMQDMSRLRDIRGIPGA